MIITATRGSAQESAHRIWRSYLYWTHIYKRTWRASLASGFLTPALFMAAMGVGLGTLVDRHGSSAHQLGGVSYLDFIAPGLLAASAMQMAAIEGMFPVMAGIKWIKFYQAMLATPITVTEVLYAHLLWMATRVAMVSAIFLGAMFAFGAPRSPEVLAAVPVAVLTGMSMAVPSAAFTATRESDQALIGVIRFVVMPMFLFSGTFFPLSQMPAWIRPLAYITPLWHGVALCRSLSLGDASWAASLGHVAYLLVVIAGATLVARRTFSRRLAA
ncbi:MAG TPA: ABC transporter permease [Acidimicrobiales bacterium]|nr:ABC transporter permease [Acidimicrobiales bacterium]